MLLTLETESGTIYRAHTAHGVHVPALSTARWHCVWNRFVTRQGGGPHPTMGVHTWTEAGKDDKPLFLLSNAAWAPGLERVRPVRVTEAAGFPMHFIDEFSGYWPARFHMALRDKYHMDDRSSLSVRAQCFEGVGNPRQAGDTGGWRIWPHPWDSQCIGTADLIAQRNPIAAFHATTGDLLTRKELGRGHEYRMERAPVGDRFPLAQQHPQFVPGLHDTIPDDIAQWHAIDRYHLIRAFADDLVAWRAHQDPIARTRILMLAADVLAAHPLDLAVPGDYNLGRILVNLRAQPHLGNVGVIRGWAWTIRAVAAAREVWGKPHRVMDAWLRAAIEAFELVQLPSGAFADHRFLENLDMGEPWVQGGLSRENGECPIWQANFMPRSLLEAAKLLDAQQVAKVRGIVERFLRVYDTCPRVPGEKWREQDPDGPPGLPLYVVTSVQGAPEPTIRAGAWPTSRFIGEPDVFAVAHELGLIGSIPQEYVRAGPEEYMQAVYRIAGRPA